MLPLDALIKAPEDAAPRHRPRLEVLDRMLRDIDALIIADCAQAKDYRRRERLIHLREQLLEAEQ